MRVAKTIKSVRRITASARSEGETIGLVPTMGALHIGHISLIEAAVLKCDFVIVSIFVNPTQFGPKEDIKKYPRPFEEDLKICRKAGVDIVFAPSVEQMYESENLTWVNVEKLSELLCGQDRPGHFRGVATVCAKLFNISRPDIAFFGQKDAQQVILIKRMVADLNIRLKIAVCPTVREASGLAVSSRNKYLTEKQKKDAGFVFKSLQKCQKMVKSGVKDTGKIVAEMNKILGQIPSIKPEYVSIVDAETLQKLDKIAGKAVVAVAVRIGTTRLIDNILVDLHKK